MSAPPTTRRVRLAELIAMISLGTDLGLGQPMEHVLRQTLIAMRLAERLGLDERARSVVYHVSLIAWVGCHVDAYEQAKWFGDDLALKADAHPRELVGLPAKMHVMSRVGAGRPWLERGRLGLRFAAGGLRPREAIENHWLATNALATALGLGPEVRAAVHQTFERWDGKGVPSEARGDEILLPARLVNLADVIALYHRAGGVDAAVAVARERSGTQFDPALVDRFCADAPAVLDGIDAVEAWPAVIDAAPALELLLSDDALDSALEAIADFTDLKSPWTIGHSRGVADLAFGAAPAYGLPGADARTVRRAGLVHDLGRLGVSNAIWDKRGPLTAAEQERVRLHPYLSERMLASSPALAPLGAIAVQHHERLDGSGYPRGLAGDAITPAGRLLAAADAYQAMTQPRPHRAALAAADAAAELRAGVRRARFDGDAVEAVLGAAGHAARRRREGPEGLTSREVEVLRLLVRGLSNREIAEQLVISPRTAGSHVEHIYVKLGVSNRAQASLFAVTHGLMAAG
jgi:HD-GYP domain-containing protein (c-di-GMP phosphodiesterase class II)